MTNSIDTINCQLVVALAAESKPIVQHFGLKPVQSKPYRCYENDTIALVESGVGALNAAAATAYALSVRARNTPSCVNIGIAGGLQDIGTPIVAHRFEDLASGKRWFPQLTWNPCSDLETAAVVTVAKPESNYEPGIVFDMEASGFVCAATRHTTLDLIQSVKIVSDNSLSTYKNLDKKDVASLIEKNMHTLEQCIHKLQSFAKAAPDVSVTEQLLTRLVNPCQSANSHALHFSASQTHELRRILERYWAIFDKPPCPTLLGQYSSSRDLIRLLGQSVDDYKQHY